jgi:hypothetical protein
MGRLLPASLLTQKAVQQRRKAEQQVDRAVVRAASGRAKLATAATKITISQRFAGFRVFVASVTGKTVTLDVSRHDSIADVKTKLAKKLTVYAVPEGSTGSDEHRRIPDEELVLEFGSEQVEDKQHGAFPFFFGFSGFYPAKNMDGLGGRRAGEAGGDVERRARQTQR